jgi:hypothetical protein
MEFWIGGGEGFSFVVTFNTYYCGGSGEARVVEYSFNQVGIIEIPIWYNSNTGEEV